MEGRGIAAQHLARRRGPPQDIWKDRGEEGVTWRKEARNPGR